MNQILTKCTYMLKINKSIDKRENSGLKYLDNSKAFTIYLHNIDDIYKKY